MSETEITNAQYNRFLSENPRWRKSNLPELLSEGKVTDKYLQEWEDDFFPRGLDQYPVVSLSHHAALAYCAWLETKLPVPLAAYTVRLPFTEEWEWATFAGEGEGVQRTLFKAESGSRPVTAYESNGFGLKGMMGSVWEWCADWFLPSKNLLIEEIPLNVPSLEARAFGGSERVVKGGSWANKEGDMRIYTRGSQPPDWCTPYLGFRIVLVRD